MVELSHPHSTTLFKLINNQLLLVECFFSDPKARRADSKNDTIFKTYKIDLETLEVNETDENKSRRNRGNWNEYLSPDGNYGAYINNHNLWIRNITKLQLIKYKLQIAKYHYKSLNLKSKNTIRPY